jgi:membrane-bound metal-dependent hydrolase YbcI (DUF457 family)
MHVAAGYVVQRFATRSAHSRLGDSGGLFVLGAAAILALLPDLDSVLGLLTGNFGKYHHNLSHSVFVGVAVALIVGGLAAIAGRGGFRYWFFIALGCYESHIVLDYFTWGRGVMALWPMVSDRFSSAIPLFYGVHWSDGLVTSSHLLTIVSEAPLALIVLLAVRRLPIKKCAASERSMGSTPMDTNSVGAP